MPYNIKLIALTLIIWIGLTLAAMNIAAKVKMLQEFAGY